MERRWRFRKTLESRAVRQGASTPIHTHDHSGKIHIESDGTGTFTLGQFFAVWGVTLNGTTLADLTGMPVVVYVTDRGDTEATLVEEADWDDIELTDISRNHHPGGH